MAINWHQLLVPGTPLLELVIRGSVMYFSLLVLLRVLVRRHIGSLNLMDLLLIVLIADAAQNAMAADYRSITEGLVLCGTLIGWNYFLDWAAFRSKFIAGLLEPAPLPVVRNGRILHKNLRQEFVTRDELLSQLRGQGVMGLDEVKLAFIEPDGTVSVIKQSSDDAGSKEVKKRSPGT